MWNNAFATIKSDVQQFVEGADKTTLESFRSIINENCFLLITVRNIKIGAEVSVTLDDFLKKVEPLELALFEAVNFENIGEVKNAADMITALSI